jgi:site-specific DNA-cytosine methylase
LDLADRSLNPGVTRRAQREAPECTGGKVPDEMAGSESPSLSIPTTVGRKVSVSETTGLPPTPSEGEGGSQVICLPCSVTAEREAEDRPTTEPRRPASAGDDGMAPASDLSHGARGGDGVDGKRPQPQRRLGMSSQRAAEVAVDWGGSARAVPAEPWHSEETDMPGWEAPANIRLPSIRVLITDARLVWALAVAQPDARGALRLTLPGGAAGSQQVVEGARAALKRAGITGITNEELGQAEWIASRPELGPIKTLVVRKAEWMGNAARRGTTVARLHRSGAVVVRLASGGSDQWPQKLKGSRVAHGWAEGMATWWQAWAARPLPPGPPPAHCRWCFAGEGCQLRCDEGDVPIPPKIAEEDMTTKQRREAAQRLQKVLRRRLERHRDTAARYIAWTWKRRRVGIFAPLQRPIPRCRWGTRLASDAEFAAQRARSKEVRAHYRTYTRIFRRMSKGASPVVGDLYCCEGAVSRAIERLGGVPRGMDLVRWPKYVEKFGEQAFVQGNVSAGRLRARLGRVDCVWASPPCKAGSTMAAAGGGLTDSRAPQLIDVTRRLLEDLRCPYILENVMGSAAKGLIRKDVVLRNRDFGLRANRPRVYESNRALQAELDSSEMGQRCCLGSNHRMSQLDFIGRKLRDTPWPDACCDGRTCEAVYGTPRSEEEVRRWEAAQGAEAGEFTKAGLAQMIPSDAAEYLVGQLIAHVCHERWGVDLISFTEAKGSADAKARLHRWEHGQEHSAVGGRAAERTAGKPPRQAQGAGTAEQREEKPGVSSAGGEQGEAGGSHASAPTPSEAASEASTRLSP